MKMFFAGLMILAATSVMADTAANSTYVELNNFNAAYDVSQVEGLVKGSLRGLGDNVGSIEFQKNGEVWKGHWGTFQVQTTAPKLENNGSTSFSVRVLPSGVHSFSYKTTARGTFEVYGRLGNGESVQANLEQGLKYNIYNRRFNMNASRQNLEKLQFSGMGHLLVNGRWYASDAVLETKGTLEMDHLSKQDPVLWVLLHVIPYNLYR